MSALDQVKKMESLKKQSPTGSALDQVNKMESLREQSPTGIRPKTERDGMKPCVEGNCGQKSVTGKMYKDYI